MLKTVWKRQGLPISLIVIGVIMAIAGLLFATVLRPDSTVRASSNAPETPYFTTHEGVLNLIGDHVTVTATAPEGQEIVMAMGRSDDVDAWLKGLSYTEIMGLESWDTLKLKTVKGDEDAAAGTPGSSDMWVEVKTGEGTVTWEIDEPQANYALLISTDGTEMAPTVTLSWEQTKSLAWAITLIVVGLVLALLGATLLIYRRNQHQEAVEDGEDEDEAKRRADELERRKAELERQRRADTPEKTTIETEVAGRKHVLPSRRAIREARERGEATVTVGGRSFETGLIPIVKQVRDPEAESAAPSNTQDLEDKKAGDNE